MNEFDQQYIKETWPRVRNGALVLLIVLLVLLSFRGCKAERELELQAGLNTSLKEEMKVWKDKDGNSVAHIGVLEAENSKFFTDLTTKDSSIIQLQNLVKKYEKQIKHTGAAVVINTAATIHSSSPTTVIEDKKDPCNPTYENSFELKDTKGIKWVWGSTVSDRKTTTVDVSIKEEIDAVIGVEKTGFLGLGKGKLFAEITLHNPYNKVQTLKAYSNAPLPIKRFGIGPVLAYGVGTGFTPQVFIGIGVNWNLIRL